MDLAGGDTKIKQKLSVVGTSTFTGDSTFNGNLSVTNGKFNNVDVPSLNTDVTKLKTDVTTINTTLTNVSAGSFAGKAISGATDITATGTGTFNSVSTSNIDINGDILSTTGKKFILGNTANGLSFTNGVTDATKASSLVMNATGDVLISNPVGQSTKINGMTISKFPSAWNRATILTSISGVSAINTGDLTTTGQITANSSIYAKDALYVTNKLTAKDMVADNMITGKGGVSAAKLTVDGISTLTGDVNAAGLVTASGGVKASSLIVDGASTHTGVTTATGLITANGGITTSTLTATGDVTLKAAKASGVISADGGLTTTTLTATGDAVMKGVKASGVVAADAGLTATTITTTGAATLAGDLNAKNVVIGTKKWLIEEVADANKGTRLCFGQMDAQGGKKYWTCMNSTGNLELA
jgi:hypothetical protein